MSSLHLNPVISGEGKGQEGYQAQGRHSFILPRWVCAPRTGYLDIQARWRQKVLLFSYPNLTLFYFGFENFLPNVFTVWHDALDCKKVILTRHSHGWKKQIFRFIYLFIYYFILLFFLHFCKRMQQKLQYITKARQNVEQKITEIMNGEMCAVTKATGA